MDGENATSPEASEKAEGQTRQRSTISFPYTDLDTATSLARAIHENVGLGDCDDSQLAAWSGQSPKSSGFRVAVYAGRTFGLLEGEGGNHRLTALGASIIDPSQVREAKASAFLAVPLFKALYEIYKTGVVPPTAALEREIVKLGVAEKQKGRARQVFEKSADQAGFFEHGRSKLIRPGVTAGTAPMAPKEDRKLGGGGGAGNGPPSLDPVIAALIQKLPPPKEPWPIEDRVQWLQMVAMAFNMAYGSAGWIEIKKADA